jgi:transmembrane sensor
MIEPGSEHADASALSIRSDASERLLSRHLSTAWSEADQAELDAWLESSPANRIAYWRMEAAWKQAERLSALRKPQAGAGANKARRSYAKILAAVAATVAIVAVGALSLPDSKPPPGKVYSTPVGGRLTLALKDGSRIELNTDTRLRIPSGDARHAILEKGEAYFQIRHDAAHPFEVAAGGNRIIDLGTKFSVRAGSNRVEVALIEGSARVEPASPAEGASAVILRPGDVAVATSDSLAVSRKPQAALSDKLAWRNDMLAFKYATLAEAAAEFNRYNDTKIVVADPRVAKLTIYGNFPTRDVAGFADAAQVSLKLHVENRNGEIVITR